MFKPEFLVSLLPLLGNCMNLFVVNVSDGNTENGFTLLKSLENEQKHVLKKGARSEYNGMC